MNEKELERLEEQRKLRNKLDGIAIWGFSNPAPEDLSVKCWYDPSVKKSKTNEKDKRDKDIDASGDSLSSNKRLGLSQAMDKENRVFKLKHAIESKSIKTVKEAIELLSSDTFIPSKSTIISYLRELKYKLYDEETKTEIGFKNIMHSGTSYQVPSDEPLVKRRIVYYDKDPKLGGKRITKKEHKERMKNDQ